jgi:hypothetical protein
VQTAKLVLRPTRSLSKPDATPGSRELWKAAYGMARRMIRDRAAHGTGAALTWYLDHGFRRFGFNALPIVRAAGWAAFNAHHVSKAATGSREELAREGMLTRCVRLEPAPRGGWLWAWTFDDLAGVNSARCLRRGRAIAMRAERAARATAVQRRHVARIMAEDRRAMERSRFGLTVTGVLALREAEAATV